MSFVLCLEIRISMLKYVLFHDIKQLDGEKLLELLDMIEYSLPLSKQQEDSNLHTSVLLTHHESVSITMAEVTNKSTPLDDSTSPINNIKPTTATSTVTKLENLDTSSKSSSVSR